MGRWHHNAGGNAPRPCSMLLGGPQRADSGDEVRRVSDVMPLAWMLQLLICRMRASNKCGMTAKPDPSTLDRSKRTGSLNKCRKPSNTCIGRTPLDEIYVGANKQEIA